VFEGQTNSLKTVFDISFLEPSIQYIWLDDEQPATAGSQQIP